MVKCITKFFNPISNICKENLVIIGCNDQLSTEEDLFDVLAWSHNPHVKTCNEVLHE